MPTIRAAALEREIDDLLTNRKRYLERAGWTYLLERQGPKGRVEFKIGKADDMDKRLPAYTKCGGIRAVCAWYTRFPKKIGPAERLIHLKLRKRGAWLERHPCRGRCRRNHQEWFRLSRAGGLKRVKQLVERCLRNEGDRVKKKTYPDYICKAINYQVDATQRAGALGGT
ncbi:hypothetical protein DFH08DRAFT_824641 [Mycena albidolilacea]|uniref:Bacteriophage T5 Orf172 DNA-binding domain-containing protein n=1 Tax=Mycena albidolilacea TaxID=1033008 RepID=A0AAD6Z4P5_9AGAR|nr:hypothetical protein DFH08DRAFT_824641 [Mycena albidolilacea]